MNQILTSRAFRHVVVLVAATTAAVSGCGSDSGGTSRGSQTGSVEVSDATANKPVSGQSTAGVYATVKNGTDQKISIVGAASPASENAQLHLTVDADGGAATMQQIDSIDVASGDSYSFEPGGAHIMLMDVDAATFPDGTLEMSLVLSDGSEIPFSAAVSELESSSVDELDQESIPTQSTLQG